MMCGTALSLPACHLQKGKASNLTDFTLVLVGLPHVDIIWNNLSVASVDEIGDDKCVELIQWAPLLENFLG